MGKVIVDMSVSLDGFIAGPDDSVEHPLGIGGERIHQWKFTLVSWREGQGLQGGKTNRDSEVLEDISKTIGATVVGRNMYDFAQGWGDDPPFHMPTFVITNRPHPVEVKQGGTTFTFVTDGIQSALTQAQAVAGDKNISIAGGADTVQQFIKAGLIDELYLHVAPLLLSSGKRLFNHLGDAHIDLQPVSVIESPHVTHLKYIFTKPTA